MARTVRPQAQHDPIGREIGYKPNGHGTCNRSLDGIDGQLHVISGAIGIGRRQRGRVARPITNHRRRLRGRSGRCRCGRRHRRTGAGAGADGRSRTRPSSGQCGRRQRGRGRRQRGRGRRQRGRRLRFGSRRQESPDRHRRLIGGDLASIPTGQIDGAGCAHQRQHEDDLG